MPDFSSDVSPLPEIPGTGLLEVSSSLVVRAVNARAASLLGRPKDELPGVCLRELVTAEGIHRLAEAFSITDDAALRGSAQAVPFERPAGERVYLDVEATTVETSTGPQVLVALWEVTGYVLREKRSESLATNVPGVLFQLFIRADGRFGFYYLSPRCFDLFGAAPTALMKDPTKVPIDPRDRAAFEDSLRTTFACRCDWSYEGRLRIGTLTTRWWRAEGKLVATSSQEVVLDGVAYDSTERRRTQEDLARAIRAKERFLARMSHELRTPLNAIIGSTQVIASDAYQPAQREGAIASIRESSDHLLSLVNDVLDLSTIESGTLTTERRPFDPIAMVQRVAAIARAARKDTSAQIVVSTRDVSSFLVGDERRISQILLNLLANAVKFTDSGTIEVSLTIRRVEGVPTLLAIVSDDGPGIDVAEAEQLFAPFAQGERGARRGGTGLGLSISREFAVAMGGTLSLDPPSDRGAVFRLELPIELDPRGIDSTWHDYAARDRNSGSDENVPLRAAGGFAALPEKLREEIRKAAASGDMQSLQEMLPELSELAHEHDELERLVALIDGFEIELVAQALEGDECE